MTQSDPKILVSTNWLAENLSNPALRILDGSWHMPAEKRDPLAEYSADHIAGAQFFNIDAISDATSDLPHMVPSAKQFARQVAELGISNDSQIVVYDTHGLFSAARVWWLFKHFGLDNIAVLDGGLPKWKAEERSTSNTPVTPVSGTLSATAQNHLVRDAAQVLTASETTTQIIDARPPARFKGDAPEPRAGLRAGRIPNSKNVFFKSLLTADGTLKSDADLTAAFKAQGVDLDQPVITSCGSGVTASVLALALQKIGHDNHALYDGSWSEWGALHDYPIEQG
ncbi:MAG: 3-mercaptopyruvate sulfurtransferase [Proteobacteria bacterium]|nr:3-mercaptopyruvate sulfurtransferase [Pseudomonadota bacterium]